MLTRLGQAHELAGNPDTAADCLHQAVRVMREADSAPGEADALVALGDLAARGGRRDEARAHYAEAQRALVSLGAPEEARVRARLAQLDEPGQA